jgi:hypothetical protein
MATSDANTPRTTCYDGNYDPFLRYEETFGAICVIGAILAGMCMFGFVECLLLGIGGEPLQMTIESEM